MAQKELVEVTLATVQTVDSKVYFPGKVSVPPVIAEKLEGRQRAQAEAIAATGNPEAAPMTPEAEGPEVSVGNPIEKKGSSKGEGSK